MKKTLVKYRYMQLSKGDKGLLTQLLIKVSGYSPSQNKGLIRQYRETGVVTVKSSKANGFKRIYTQADIRLLAQMDKLHQQPSEVVLKKLCERKYTRSRNPAYQRLATISVSHLYNPRQTTTYQRQRCILTKTRSNPKATMVGLRGKPSPNDQPDYIHIDSLHQGDQDKRKGVYHINAVDDVIQMQVVVTLERSVKNLCSPPSKRSWRCSLLKYGGFMPITAANTSITA